MTRKLPIVREISWPSVLPQLLSLVAAVAIFAFTLGWSGEALIWGAGSFLAYSVGSRAVLPRSHRAGMAALRERRYSEALEHFRTSYDFFGRWPRLDGYRSIIMMSPSAASYREMALINEAFCHAQLGNGAEARETYERAVHEFPDSPLAHSALQLIKSVTQPPSAVNGGKAT